MQGHSLMPQAWTQGSQDQKGPTVKPLVGPLLTAIHGAAARKGSRHKPLHEPVYRGPRPTWAAVQAFIHQFRCLHVPSHTATAKTACIAQCVPRSNCDWWLNACHLKVV